MNWKGKKILVVGDIMLDRYLVGSAERISPEAPVPIITIRSENCVPGGAGNTANNISAMGGEAVLIGTVGPDYARDLLIDELKKRNILDHGIVVDNSKQTMQKVRLVSRRQQLVRMDYEDLHYVSAETTNAMVAAISRQIDIDAILVSDYAKGTLTQELMDALKSIASIRKIPLLVDPRPKHTSWYRNATVITPNKKETEEMTGIKINNTNDLVRAGSVLCNALNCHVVVTMGEQGMSLFEKDKLPIHIPTMAKEIYDVSGAGDTVISTLALALAAGHSLEEACHIANHAAGIVVGKFGTATATVEEILESIGRNDGARN